MVKYSVALCISDNVSFFFAKFLYNHILGTLGIQEGGGEREGGRGEEEPAVEDSMLVTQNYKYKITIWANSW